MKTNIRRKALGTLVLLAGFAGAPVPGECADLHGWEINSGKVPAPGSEVTVVVVVGSVPKESSEK